MSLVLGLNAKTYFRNPTNYAEATNVKDMTLALEVGEADVTTRGGNGWRQKVGTLKDGSIEFEMIWDTSDLFFTKLKTAFLAGTSVDMLIMDGDRTAAAGAFQGLQATMVVLSFTREEKLEDALTVKVKMAPTYGTAPAWVSSPVA